MACTQIVNHTSKAMKVKVFNRVFRDLATVEKDGLHMIAVDPNSTYHEFCMVDAAGEPLIMDSDQLVDNICITIAESADGKFQVFKVPRIQNSMELQEASCTPPSPAAPASISVDPLEAPISLISCTWLWCS